MLLFNFYVVVAPPLKYPKSYKSSHPELPLATWAGMQLLDHLCEWAWWMWWLQNSDLLLQKHQIISQQWRANF